MWVQTSQAVSESTGCHATAEVSTTRGSTRSRHPGHGGEPTTFRFSFNALGALAAPAASPASSASASSASSVWDHHLPSEYFGAFMASSTAESSLAPFRSDGSSILMLVDSEATDSYLDPALTPGVRGHMRDIEDLRIPLPIIAAGQHVLHGVTTGFSSARSPTTAATTGKFPSVT